MNRKYAGTQILQNIYRRIADDCPAWWSQHDRSFNSLLYVVDGMCAMFARDKFTDKEVAQFWDSPLNFVHAVKRIRADQIEDIRKEYQECLKLAEVFAACDEGVMVSEEEAILSLVELIFEGYETKEKREQE